MSEPTTPEPKVKRVSQPPAPRSPRLCASCDAAMEGRFCSACGAEATPGGARGTNLIERIAKLEADRAADAEAVAPLRRLVEKLRDAGLDPEDVDAAQLGGIASFMKGGGGAGIGSVMSQLFPGLNFGAKAKTIPVTRDPDDDGDDS